MPNHCENSTVIWGSPSKVKEVIEAMADSTNEGGFSLSQLVPMPEGLKGTTANFCSATPPENWAKMLAEGKWTQEEYDKSVARNKADWEAKQARIDQYGYGDWYEWACSPDNWGTKWGDYSHSGEFPDISALEESTDGRVAVEFTYDTAWGPFSDQFWKQVSDRFPEVRFETRYQEPGWGFAGVTIALGGIVADEGTDNLPEIDWDTDDCGETWYDQMDVLLNRLYDLADMKLAIAGNQPA